MDQGAENRCAIVVIAEGFDETAAVAILSGLRQAGARAKSVGLVKGLIGGLHGVWLMPDLTLTDLDGQCEAMGIDLVILPGSRPYLAKLEPDPRVHRLIQRVLDGGGSIATNADTLRFLRDRLPASAGLEGGRVLLRFPEQSGEAFVEELVYRYVRQAPVASRAYTRYAPDAIYG